MIITLFEGQRSETYNSLSEAADDDLLDAVEEHKKRVACAVEGRDDYYPKPRLTVIGIEGTPAGAH
jgi:hypothetical protein